MDRTKSLNHNNQYNNNQYNKNQKYNQMETFENFDNIEDLDNIDCSKYFQDIYDKILQDFDIEQADLVDKDLNKCTNCESTNFMDDTAQGIKVCSDCGVVASSLFDARYETRIYDEDNKGEKARCNKVTNELLPKSSLGTRLPSNIRGNLQKLQNWGAMPYRERALYNDFKKIDDKCDKLGLKKNIQDTAHIFYAAAKSCKHEEGENKGKFIITRGKNNKGIQAASIWISCNSSKTPILSKDIADQFDLTVKELNKGIKSLTKLLCCKNMNVNIEVVGSEEYVRKYCIELKIKTDYMNQAIKIAKNIDRLNLASEHTQYSIAATSVLIMSELNNITTMTKKRLKTLFGVSSVTIAKTYKKVEKIKHILTNDEKVEKLLVKFNTHLSSIKLTDVIKDRMKKFGIDAPVESESAIKIEVKDNIQTKSQSLSLSQEKKKSITVSDSDSLTDSSSETEEIKTKSKTKSVSKVIPKILIKKKEQNDKTDKKRIIRSVSISDI